MADRTAYKLSVMINRYCRQTRPANELRLGTLAPLNKTVPEVRETSAAVLAHPRDNVPGNTQSLDFESSMISEVPKVGIEPTSPCEQRILSPPRLPVPPLRPSDARCTWSAAGCPAIQPLAPKIRADRVTTGALANSGQMLTSTPWGPRFPEAFAELGEADRPRFFGSNRHHERSLRDGF